MYKYNERDVQTRRAIIIHSRGRKKLWVKCDRFIDRHSRDERKIRLKITSLGKFGVSTTNVDTPIARSWSFRLFFFFFFFYYARRHKREEAFCPDAFRCYVIVEHRMNLFLCPHPPHPPPQIDTRHLEFSEFRAAPPSTFLERYRIETIAHVHDARENEREKKKKREKAASVLHPLHERKHVLSLSTFVRVNDRRAKIGTWMRGKG